MSTSWLVDKETLLVLSGWFANLSAGWFGSIFVLPVFTDTKPWLLLTVNFPDVGTTNYMVLGGLLSKSTNYVNDANVYSQTREHTATSFKLIVKEQYGSVFQNLTFQFVIIAL